MYAAIASVDLRSNETSCLNFKLDENSFNKLSDRVVSKIETLDGTVVVKDWGYAEGRKEINLTSNVSFDDYETLEDFQEDNSNTFLFHYKDESYVVIIRSVRKNSIVGERIIAAVKMDVVQKLNGDGEYTV